jgi:hypothetical protein
MTASLHSVRWLGKTHYGYVHNTGGNLCVTEYAHQGRIASSLTRRKYISTSRYSQEEAIQRTFALVQQWMQEADR